MKMKKILTVLFMLCILASSVVFAGGSQEPAVWLTDLDQATLAAEESGKDLLVFFSGLGWDGYSEKFISEILSQEKFLKEVGKNYVPVQIDLILDEESLTEEEIAVNQNNYMLAYSMGISSVPTLLATSSDAIPYGIITYGPDSSDLSGILAEFKEVNATRAKIASLKKKLEKSTGVSKAQVIDELYNSVPTEFSYQFYDLITEFPSLDPENKTGKLGQYKLLLAYDESLAIFNESGDIEAAIKVFIDLAESGLLNSEEYQTAYYNVAYLESYGGQILTENTISYLQKAYDAAPESEIADSILATIESIQAMNSESTTETTGESY